jgi:hypothetical protein
MKNRRTRIASIASLACAATLAVLAGCSSGSGPETPAAPKTVVYAAGYYGDGYHDFPCYWRDGTRVALPYDGKADGWANSITVSGGTVYAAGATGDGHTSNPSYWTGATRTDLAGESAVRICVAGGTVYTAVNGDWSTEETTAFGGAYYEGATFNRLKGVASGDPARPERDTTVNDIVVAGGTVYTAGRAAFSDDDSYACYWTGPDARTDLDASSEAFAICVSGGTVYTAGNHFDDYYSAHFPCYWTDTDMTYLPAAEGTEGYARDIAVDGGTVYTAGYCDYTSSDTHTYHCMACYWIDDERYDLPGEGTNNAQAYGICVLEGSVYVSGYYNDGTKDIPCYWKDGVKVDLPGGEYGYANDIVVVKE